MSWFKAIGCCALIHFPLALNAADGDPKPATEFTKRANLAAAQTLPFDDTRDFADARRGFIAGLPDGGVVKNAAGQVVWDPRGYDYIQPDAAAPDTIHPSLWRQAQLLTINGLFAVTDRIYQVRGYDISCITFIEGERGITVLDPLVSAETAKASLDLYLAHRPPKPIVAVIYSHSHVDHFGGVRGIVDPADVAAGKVQVVAPAGFAEEAVSENVLAGNVMSRRASYMFGPLLPKNPRGQATAGLGLTTSSGEVTVINPTVLIKETGEKLTLDGLTYEFQMAPGSEAPAEMHFLIRELKALCPAENATHTLHNLYTLRGAKTRDAKAWAGYLTELLELFGDEAEVLFAPHHWPVWGQDRIREHVTKMRDTYQYLHDQSLRLANRGYTMVEVAEMLRLPPELEANWASRGYYGSVNHNAKAVYNFYLGWFDGNPATLHELPPAVASKRYVEFMGGADSVVEKARRTFDGGDYRWTAQVLNHVVLAQPDHQPARGLLADTLEQLGYQSENAVWRNFYLTGAQELRQGVQKSAPGNTRSPDMVSAMSLDVFFDYLAIRLNGPKANGKRFVINFDFPDVGEKFVVRLENSVLTHSSGKREPQANASVTFPRAVLNQVILGKTTLPGEIAAGRIRIEGDAKAVQQMFALLDSFDFWFNIVTPNPGQ
ncbi:MAG: MBL fold metallo-hydrolase [Planctomycetaceae bacterium]|nr:MBL fold metallo-hydrolase [Planctomycetaceae bacterium]